MVAVDFPQVNRHDCMKSGVFADVSGGRRMEKIITLLSKQKNRKGTETKKIQVPNLIEAWPDQNKTLSETTAETRIRNRDDAAEDKWSPGVYLQREDDERLSEEVRSLVNKH